MKAILLLTILSTSSFANNTATDPQTPNTNASLYVDSYCSARTLSGEWFVYHSSDIYFRTCDYVFRVLRNRTGEPVSSYLSGWISRFNYGGVRLTCDNTRFVDFRGYGLDPLYNAYNHAMLYNLSGCLFRVF